MSVSLGEINGLLETHYPPAWAMAGDKVGLQIGNPAAAVDTILVALEATPATVAAARALPAQLLLTHHPLLYRPLADIIEDRPLGGLVAELIRAQIGLISCHTNLDAAPGGLNDYLAKALGLERVEVLAPDKGEALYKLVVFVPVGYEDRVRQALGEAGLGVIGRYSHCAFTSRGQGIYRPLPGARPFQGEVGKLARAVEARLEILAPESLLPAALRQLKEVHPYEEVAYDLYPLKNSGTPLGFGRVGDWPEPRPFTEVLALVKRTFGVAAIQVWGTPPARVQRLAVCGGSGGDLIDDARAAGAQIYVTGEVRHHQMPAGGFADLAVLAVGHFASEVGFMEPWSEQLRGFFTQAGLAVTIAAAPPLGDPLTYR